MGCGVMAMHAGKRNAVFEEVIELDNGKFLDCLLLQSVDPKKHSSCIQLQKTVGKVDNLTVMNGGVMIDVDKLPELKAIVDQMYMRAIELGLV